MDTTELQILIKELNKKSIQKERLLKENIKSFNKYLDPVYHINNVLPDEVPITFKLNNLLDETISDATHVLNNKISAQTGNSFLLKSGTSMVTKMVSKTVFSNRNKIKAVGLAILKNILS